MDQPVDGKLHVNVGWYVLWMPHLPTQRRIANDSLNPGVEELMHALGRIAEEFELEEGEMPLEFPHLSNYPNMASFPHTCEQRRI